jgi:hypothetical protein
VSVQELEIRLGDLEDQIAEIHYIMSEGYPVITRCMVHLGGSEVDVKNSITATARQELITEIRGLEGLNQEASRAKVGDRDVS